MSTLDKHLGDQPLGPDKLTSINQKIENGDIHAQYLLPLQERIKTEVAKLTDEQQEKVLPILNSIEQNTQYQFTRSWFKTEMLAHAANDDFWQKLAA